MGFDRAQIHEGMAVRTSTGQPLGKVIAANDRTFRVERRDPTGLRRYPVRYTDVEAIVEDSIVLRVDESDLRKRNEGDPRISGDTPRVAVERDTMQMGAGEVSSRYEEHTIRVSEDGAKVERRNLSQRAFGTEEHGRQQTVDECEEDTSDRTLAPDALPAGVGGSGSEHP